MLRSITAKQFTEWEYYAQLEPFDETRADYRTASIVSMIYNTQRGKSSPKYTIADFLLNFGDAAEQRRKPTQTREDHIAMIKRIAQAYSVPAEDI